MEILFGLVIVAVKLILEHVAVRHANKYSDKITVCIWIVVRRSRIAFA